MAVFNCHNSGLEIIIKPVEIKDHLCGRLVVYRVLFRFNNGTALLLPELFDDGRILPFFSSILDNINKNENNKYSYNNRYFNYLNEPLYSINIDCYFKEKSISQPTLFSEESFGVEQLNIFNSNTTDLKNFIEIELIINKAFKENCCWEDFMDYVMSQQNIAKIINNRTKSRLNISIENGCLDDLLLGNENLEKEMNVCTSIKIKQNIEDFRTSIFQLKTELDEIKPIESTIIESNIPGQKCFDLGPEAKPFVDVTRLKRLNELKLQLENIFSLKKNSREQALFEISANIEFFISEELRKALRRIFFKYSDRESISKALEGASNELFISLPDFENEEELINSIIFSDLISESISKIILQARSPKNILYILDRINEENSLKKILSLFIK